MDRGNACLRHVFLTLSEFIGDYTMTTVSISATTSKLITRAISGFEKCGTTLTQSAEALFADGVRYDMLKGEKPTEASKAIREQVKVDIAAAFTKDELSVYFADKKTAKDFNDTLKLARKAAQDKVSQYFKRICEAMPDAPVAEPKQAEAKTQADKLRIALETALKIVQGEPDDSLADMLTLSKGLQDLIAATYLKQGKNL
jgi:hypothetical protein